MRRVAIVGPGAVAGVVAWRLAHADCALTLIARPATAAILQREGLSLIGGGADPTPRRIAVTSDAVASGPQDLVLVGFKAQDWRNGLDAVRPLMGPETILVPILNGIPWWFFQGFGGVHEGRILRSVDPGGALAAEIPIQRVLGCVAYIAAERETPSRIRWNGRQRFVLGEPLGGARERLSDVVSLLRMAGIDAVASHDIRHDIWAKLLGNVTYNPLSVAAHATMGRMSQHPPLRQIVQAMMEEAVAVARALGVAGPFDVEERLRMRPEMFDVRTSMLQDFDAGRPLELGGIVDAVVEVARVVGVATPMIETIGALAYERQVSRMQCDAKASFSTRHAKPL